MTFEQYKNLIALCVALAFFAASVLLPIAIFAAPQLRRLARHKRLFAFAAAGLAFFAVSKQQLPTFSFDIFLQDDGSYAANDTVHVAFRPSTYAGDFDLSASSILVYARAHGETNAANFVTIDDSRTIADYPRDYAFPDATNYNYFVFCNYVPPSPVHTNGVWQTRLIDTRSILDSPPDDDSAVFAIP